MERNLAHFSFGFRVDARTTSTLGGKQFYYTSNNYIAVNIVVTPTVFPNCYRPARNHFQFSSLRFIEDKFLEVLPLIILNIKSNFSKFDIDFKFLFMTPFPFSINSPNLYPSTILLSLVANANEQSIHRSCTNDSTILNFHTSGESRRVSFQRRAMAYLSPIRGCKLSALYTYTYIYISTLINLRWSKLA